MKALAFGKKLGLIEVADIGGKEMSNLRRRLEVRFE